MEMVGKFPDETVLSTAAIWNTVAKGVVTSPPRKVDRSGSLRGVQDQWYRDNALMLHETSGLRQQSGLFRSENAGRDACWVQSVRGTWTTHWRDFPTALSCPGLSRGYRCWDWRYYFGGWGCDFVICMLLIGLMIGDLGLSFNSLAVGRLCIS